MSTYVPIQAITLGSNATDISFTGIPQTFTDLVVVCSVRSTRASADDTLLMQVNSDTTSLYSGTWMVGSGTAATSSRNSSQTAITAAVNIEAANATASTFTPVLINVQNYSNTTTNKTVLMRHSAPTREVGASVGLWRSTSAISSIKIYASIGSLASGSTFTLYGIGSGAPKAMGGTTIVTDGAYWYHAFQGSGVFEPLQNLTADILVIAGGAGGGNDKGGGGGAGAIVYATNQSLSTKTTITVGAGGPNGVATEATNSTFGTLITATRGGRPNGLFGATSETGGSGGGGGRAGYGGAASSYSGVGTKYGNAGGNGQIGDPAPYAGGGGGGAGAAGGGAGAGGGGAGGAGLSTWSAWATATKTGSSGFYAGGGGGGTYTSGGGGAGGSGGGGAGGGTGTGTPGTSALQNTGSGGGGGGNVGNGGNGGSGIVIVRYAV